MERTKVSARTLSDTFVRRMQQIFPKVYVTGFEVESLGDGKWRPRAYFGPIPDPMLAEAYALVSEMQSQFDLCDI